MGKKRNRNLKAYDLRRDSWEFLQADGAGEKLMIKWRIQDDDRLKKECSKLLWFNNQFPQFHYQKIRYVDSFPFFGPFFAAFQA